MERVYKALGLFAVILVIGTVLFRQMERMDWFDSFYATLLSITPLGHGLMPPLSPSGRKLNAILLICGVGVVGYAASIATRFVFEGEMGRVFWRRKVHKRLERMEGHFVVCGHGRVGSIVAAELDRHGADFVVVESQEAAVRQRVADGRDVLIGDATDERVLAEAGIGRAAGLIAALRSDADNLYITLSAREMNPNIRIVARASDEAAAAKLRRAGAQSTVSPNIIGGKEMAQHLLMPAVVDFIHLATGRQSLDLQMHEIHVRPDSRLAGVALGESPVRREHGVIVVAVYKKGGVPVFNPASDCVLAVDDTLICLGHPERLAAMRELAEERA
jgi:voltage-gated potassium channel